jgi:hypothetical protein
MRTKGASGDAKIVSVGQGARDAPVHKQVEHLSGCAAAFLCLRRNYATSFRQTRESERVASSFFRSGSEETDVMLSILPHGCVSSFVLYVIEGITAYSKAIVTDCIRSEKARHATRRCVWQCDAIVPARPLARFIVFRYTYVLIGQFCPATRLDTCAIENGRK